jgi:predicted dehydrogenase
MGMTDTNMATCKIAIVGAGNMASEHARAFADVPGVQISGIHSRTRSKAEALANAYNARVIADSIDELYERTRADLVVVTVKELAMNACSRACFKHPWTVLLEKPAGYNLADAIEIHDAARKAGARVFVALNRRAYSSTRAVGTAVAEVQGPRFVRVQDQQDQPAMLAAGQPQLVVDNFMFANSIHLIDYFAVFCRGRATGVDHVVKWNASRPGLVLAKVNFDSGDAGLYEGIWDGPGPWAVTVQTSERRWEMRPLEQAAVQFRGERKLQALEIHEWDARFKPGLRYQAEQAVAAALGKPAAIATLDESLESMKLVDMIFREQ